MNGFVSFGTIYLAVKLLKLAQIDLMENVYVFVQIVFAASILAFLISWLLSNAIYHKKRYV